MYKPQYIAVGNHNKAWAGYNDPANGNKTFMVEVYYQLYDEYGKMVYESDLLDKEDAVENWQSEKDIKNGETDDYEFQSTIIYNGERYVWTSTDIWTGAGVNTGTLTPGNQNGTITINDSGATIIGKYIIQRDLKVYIHLMLDTKQHDAGSELCIDYTNTSKKINYTGGDYKNGIATYTLKKNEERTYNLLSVVNVGGVKYELINSYLQFEGNDKTYHVDSSYTKRSPGPIDKTLHIVAEYKQPASVVRVWCLEDTDVHNQGDASCVHYLNNASKRIFDEPETFPIEVGEATKIQLQSSIEKDGQEYILINSHINNYAYHVSHIAKDGAEAFPPVRNLIINSPTETIDVTAEYKLKEEDPLEPTEVILSLERLNPLFEAQIMSDDRSNTVTSNPKDNVASTNVSTQKYNVLGTYGIPTSETQYAQLLSASRNLIKMTYVKRSGKNTYEVKVTKNYPFMWWDGCYVVKGCNNTTTFSNNTSGGVKKVDSSNVADGITDSRWRHDTINCSHITIYNDKTNYAGDTLPGNCYGGGGCYISGGIARGTDTGDNAVSWDSDGRAYGTGSSYAYGGTCCDWSYSACDGYLNYCPGHTRYITVSKPCTDSCPEDCPGGHTGTEKEEYDHTPGCIHHHTPSCIRYDVCNGHADKYCTSTMFYCDGRCTGHERTYHGTYDPQCERSSSCINEETYSISRTYKYDRSWEYYYVKEYDAYKLGEVRISNPTLGNAGSVTVNPTEYSMANFFYKGNEFLGVNSGTNARWVENGHVMEPLKEHTIIHDFNKEIDDTTHKNITKIKGNAATGKENYTNRQYALNVAMTQAAWDLGLGGNMSSVNTGNRTYTYEQYKQVGNEKMKNDIWMLGETKTVLRVKNDYLWHDGHIMEMYAPTRYYGYNSETWPYRTDSLYDTNITPDIELYDFTKFGTRYAYYMTNRTDVTATGKDPEETTSKTYTTETGGGKAGNKTEIRTNSSSIYEIYINGIYSSKFVTPTTKYNTLNTSYMLGWGTRATGARGLLWYQNGIVIPKTIKNGVYDSFATATYLKVDRSNIANIRNRGISGSADAQETVAANQPNVNSVTVHTPVYISASIVQGATSTQMITPITTSTSLELDKEYVLRANTTGQHRLNRYGTNVNQNGYGNKNYEKWIKNITGNKLIQAHFPYDVYIKTAENTYTFLKAGTWITFPNNSNDLTFKVPVWTIEKEYAAANLNTGNDEQILANTIVVRAIAENDPADGLDDTIGRRYANKEGTTAATQNILYTQISYDYRAYDAVNTNIVGKVYDFRFEYTDDDAYETTMQTSFSGIYANELPFAQQGDNPGKPSYTYALKLGSKLKYSLKTKGTKSSEIQIVPTVYYVRKSDCKMKSVDLYYEINGNKYEKLTINSTIDQFTALTKAGELPDVPSESISNTRAIYRELVVGTLKDDTWSGIDYSAYNYDKEVVIGKIGKLLIGENLRLRFDAGEEYEADKIYGTRSEAQIKNEAGSALNFIKSISQWYGELRIPSTVVFTDTGKSLYDSNGNMQNIKMTDKTNGGDGYLIVFFNIKTLDTKGKEYLSYQLPKDNTQWDKEGYDYTITLPNGKTFTYTTPKTTDCAGIAIYEGFINTEGNVVGPN